jgi:hypothetical protein
LLRPAKPGLKPKLPAFLQRVADQPLLAQLPGGCSGFCGSTLRIFALALDEPNHLLSARNFPLRVVELELPQSKFLVGLAQSTFCRNPTFSGSTELVEGFSGDVFCLRDAHGLSLEPIEGPVQSFAQFARFIFFFDEEREKLPGREVGVSLLSLAPVTLRWTSLATSDAVYLPL